VENDAANVRQLFEIWEKAVNELASNHDLQLAQNQLQAKGIKESVKNNTKLFLASIGSLLTIQYLTDSLLVYPNCGRYMMFSLEEKSSKDGERWQKARANIFITEVLRVKDHSFKELTMRKKIYKWYMVFRRHQYHGRWDESDVGHYRLTDGTKNPCYQPYMKVLESICPTDFSFQKK
jgi:hypothetical protein